MTAPATAHPSAQATLLRPSLEYQHAFDLCAMEACQRKGLVLVISSSPFHTRELLDRLSCCEIHLLELGKRGDDVISPAPLLPSSRYCAPSLPSSLAQTIIWAEPDWASAEEAWQSINRLLLPDARVYIIISGWLARFLPEWKEADRRPAKRPLGLSRTSKRLRQAGFQIQASYGFHGPASIFWGYAAQALVRLGRGDWADRCHFQMRAMYAVHGWQALGTPVSAVVAGRK